MNTGQSKLRLTLRILAVVLALSGFWLSLDLLRITGGANATNPLLAQQCGSSDPNQPPSDCLSVLRSEFAYPAAVAAMRDPNAPAVEGQRGLPWAALGAAYFAFVAIWYAFVGPPTRTCWAWHLLITAVVAFGIWTSIDLTLIMANELHRFCIGCLASHAVNGLLGIVTLLSFPLTPDRPISIVNSAAVDPQTGGIPKGIVGAPLPQRVQIAPRHPTTGLALSTLLACGLAFWLTQAVTTTMLLGNNLSGLNNAYQAVTNDPNFAYWQWSQQPAVEIPPRADQVWLGDAGAPNTLVVFADLQCPMCRNAYKLITEEILTKHPGQLRVAFRHYPLDRTCNPSSAATMHPAACRAAMAIEAARILGGPDAYHKMRAALYANQSQLDVSNYGPFADAAGVARVDLYRLMQIDDPRAPIAEDIAAADQLKITSVPVLYLNNRRFDHWRDPRGWEKLLEAERK